MELTDWRAKPAVYFGGKARIIDFALSNALNSGIRRIAVATQYKAHSLIRHLQRGWNFLRAERNESFDILPASQRVSEDRWYLGTADAVYQNIDIIESYGPELHRRAGRRSHLQDGLRADAAAARDAGRRRDDRLPRGAAHGGHRLRRDARRRSGRDQLLRRETRRSARMPDKPDVSLATMGIYVFDTEFLFDQLRRDAADPLVARLRQGHHPVRCRARAGVAHRFRRSCVRSEAETRSYWRDVGTVDAYWEANIDLTDVVPRLDIYDASGRSGPTARSPRPRSSCTTRMAAAAWRCLARVRRLHGVGLARSAARCCPPVYASTPIGFSTMRCSSPR